MNFWGINIDTTWPWPVWMFIGVVLGAFGVFAFLRINAQILYERVVIARNQGEEVSFDSLVGLSDLEKES